MSLAIGHLKAGGRFSAIAIAAVVLSLLGAVATVLAFVFWSAQGADERSLERQTSLARHVIQTELDRIPHDQESVTIWDDSIYRTKLLFDPRWVDANLGVWMHEYFGQDEVLILDDQNQPLYAMKDGQRIDEHEFGLRTLAQISSLIAALRRQVAQAGN